MDLHKIKILGSTEIEYPLDITKDYSIVLKRCSIKSINKQLTHEDENAIFTYNLENLDIATLIGEGETIQGKAKSASKKLRGALWHLASERGIDDTEKFYQDSINKIILNLDKIV